jgi:hypothetical protein
MTSRALTFASGVLLAALAGCETAKSSTPTAPTVAGPIAGVTISAPVLLQPSSGSKFKESEQPIQLVIQNATTNGARPLTYTVEVSTDSGFGSTVFSRSNITPGDGRTTVSLDRLPIDQKYYWRAWAEDGANVGAKVTAGFEIFPKASIGAPVAMSPGNNEEVGSTTPTIVAGNAPTVGPVGFLAYEFQVATDQAFTRLVAAGVVNEGAGQTRFNSSALTSGATLFWRVRAGDSETQSPWSSVQVFRTPKPVTPSPPPSGPVPSGGPCTSSNPMTIVQCERARYGSHMDAGTVVTFLKGLARSLTANGISGAPFGILRKNGGSSCNGYSCDIICSGNGNSQRQWDVLGDSDGAQTPAWGGPNGVPNIRVDVCEVQ